MSEFYQHRIDMISRALPAIAQLYKEDLYRVVKSDHHLTFSQKQEWRNRADLALRITINRHNEVLGKRRRRKPSVWQRFRAWLGYPSGQ